MDLNWLSTNANRAYPLVDVAVLHGNGNQLPFSLLVDAVFVLKPAAGFDPAVSVLRLVTIAYSSGTLTLGFNFTTGSTADASIPIVVAFAAGQTMTYEDDRCLAMLVVGEAATAVTAMGILSSSAVYNLLGTVGVQLEPSRIQSLRRGYVQNVSAYAMQSARWAPAGYPAAPPQLEQIAVSLVGPISFSDGYNCEVDVDGTENTVTWRTAVGAGLGEPCNPTAQPDYTAAGWTSIPGVMPHCSDLIASINGAIAGDDQNLTITCDGGAQLIPHPTVPHCLLLRPSNVGALYCESTPG